MENKTVYKSIKIFGVVWQYLRADEASTNNSNIAFRCYNSIVKPAAKLPK